MFQTAFPFGYLIQFLLFVGAVVVALVLLGRGANRRDKALFRAGLILTGMIAIVIGLAAAQPRVDDWNPRFSPSVVHGRWTADGRTLELRADSTYTLRTGSSVTTGRYRLDDWNLDLFGADGRPLPTTLPIVGLRVVEEKGEYRIIHDPYEPDVWDGWMGYRRTPPAKVP